MVLYTTTAGDSIDTLQLFITWFNYYTILTVNWRVIKFIICNYKDFVTDLEVDLLEVSCIARIRHLVWSPNHWNTTKLPYIHFVQVFRHGLPWQHRPAREQFSVTSYFISKEHVKRYTWVLFCDDDENDNDKHKTNKQVIAKSPYNRLKLFQELLLSLHLNDLLVRQESGNAA